MIACRNTWGFVVFTMLALLGPSLPLWGQQKPSGVAAEVRDGAKMFEPAAIRTANATLDRVAKEHGVPIVIETIDSLPANEGIVEEALRRHEKDEKTTLYILISRRDGKTSDVQLPANLKGKLTPARLNAIRDAFTEDFRQRRFSDGLMSALAAIEQGLVGIKPTGPELIARDQIRLNLAGAKLIVVAAEAKAVEMGLKVNIAVVDDGGHPMAFARMDGARPASAYTALTKATSAATTRLATGPFPPGTTTPDTLLNLSIQNAASASGGKFTTLYGGLPIVMNGQVIGAIGVGGGTGEQDAEVAKAGIASLLQALGGR